MNRVPMKIALFSDTYFPIVNGISVSVSLLAIELRKKGHDVTIFTHDHDLAHPEKGVIRFKGFRPPKRSLHEFRIGRVTKQKIKKVMEEHFDVIHCHTELTIGRLGKKVAEISKTPFVYTYHTMYEDYVHYISKYFKNLTRKFVIFYSVRFANASAYLIAPTDKVASKFIGYGYQGDLEIIPTGIDLEQFKATSLDPSKLDSIKKTWAKPFPHGLFVGRVSHEKNLETLLKTIKECKHEKHDWYLTVIGDGPARASLEAYVKTHQLENNVFFTGMIKPVEIAYYYQIADFFVSFSTTETQGLTYIEAMAADLPVIAQSDQHLKAWIKEGESGYLIDSVEAFKALLKRIIADPKMIKALKPSEMEILKPLNAKTYATSIEALYQKVITPKKGR
jgi:1,2-diacylglycerol 3-alpha-glucosyltransferase